jgi:hypothetical protein
LRRERAAAEKSTESEMAPGLWPFGERNTLKRDTAELTRCLPDAQKPLDWGSDSSVTSHSVVNMLKNCEIGSRRPGLLSRVSTVTLSAMRSSRSKKGAQPRHAVVFSEEGETDIPAATCSDDDASSDERCTAQTFCGTFLSATARHDCLLARVAEEEVTCDVAADSELSADDTYMEDLNSSDDTIGSRSCSPFHPRLNSSSDVSGFIIEES